MKEDLLFICTGDEVLKDGCGAKLDISEYDIYIKDNDINQKYYTFICSKCGVVTKINENKIPPLLQAKLWCLKAQSNNVSDDIHKKSI